MDRTKQRKYSLSVSSLYLSVPQTFRDVSGDRLGKKVCDAEGNIKRDP